MVINSTFRPGTKLSCMITVAVIFPSGNSSVPTGHKGYNTDYKDVNTLARLPRWKLKVFLTAIKSDSSCRAGGPQAWRSSANSQSAYSTYRKQYQVLLTLFDPGGGDLPPRPNARTRKKSMGGNSDNFRIFLNVC